MRTDAIVDWKDGQNVVIVSQGNKRLEVPLAEWVELPAVKYDAELLLESGQLKSRELSQGLRMGD